MMEDDGWATTARWRRRESHEGCSLYGEDEHHVTEKMTAVTNNGFGLVFDFDFGFWILDFDFGIYEFYRMFEFWILVLEWEW